MAIVTKTIKGNAYLYEQHSKRVGGKVVTTSRYLRRLFPQLPDLGPLRVRTYGLDWEEIERGELARQAREAAEKQAFEEKMHQEYGMRFDTPDGPVEKIPSDDGIKS